MSTLGILPSGSINDAILDLHAQAPLEIIVESDELVGRIGRGTVLQSAHRIVKVGRTTISLQDQLSNNVGGKQEATPARIEILWGCARILPGH